MLPGKKGTIVRRPSYSPTPEKMPLLTRLMLKINLPKWLRRRNFIKKKLRPLLADGHSRKQILGNIETILEDLIRDGLIKEEQVKGVTPLDILDGKVGPRVKKLVTDELMKDFGELTR